MKTKQSKFDASQCELFPVIFGTTHSQNHPLDRCTCFSGANNQSPRFNQPRPNYVRAPKKSSIVITTNLDVVAVGLKSILEPHADLSISGISEVSSSIFILERTHPDALLFIITAPLHLHVLKKIHRTFPTLAILVYSMLDQSVLPERAIRSGARGCVLKSQPLDEFASSLHRILRGELAVAPEITQRILAPSLEQAKTTIVSDHLSDAEFVVFYNIGLGKGTRQIAEQLGVSIKTVESQRAHIKEKLNLKDATQLVLEAVTWVDSLY